MTSNRNPVLFDPDNAEELLKGWLIHLKKQREKHEITAQNFDNYHYFVGLPAVIFSAIVGTAVFASLQDSADPTLKVVTIALSFASAVLVAVQTFVNFGERSEKHHAAELRYKAAIRELEQILINPVDILSAMPPEFLKETRLRLDALENDAPIIPAGINNRINLRYENFSFKDKAQELQNRPAKP